MFARRRDPNKKQEQRTGDDHDPRRQGRPRHCRASEAHQPLTRPSKLRGNGTRVGNIAKSREPSRPRPAHPTSQRYLAFPLQRHQIHHAAPMAIAPDLRSLCPYSWLSNPGGIASGGETWQRRFHGNPDHHLRITGRIAVCPAAIIYFIRRRRGEPTDFFDYEVVNHDQHANRDDGGSHAPDHH